MESKQSPIVGINSLIQPHTCSLHPALSLLSVALHLKKKENTNSTKHLKQTNRNKRSHRRRRNITKACMQSSSQYANIALSPLQISLCFGGKANHSNSVWLVSGIHLQMHTSLVLFHGCYSLISFFVQLSYPQCLRLHQAPVSGCLITECIHLHYSALSARACSSTSELCR